MPRAAYLALLLALAAPTAFAKDGHPADPRDRPASGDHWAEIAPPARAEHVSIYDAQRQRLVIFGGRVDNALRNDLWVLSLPEAKSGNARDGNQTARREDRHEAAHQHWELVRPEGKVPSPRAGSAAAYDAARDRLLIFGGRDSSGQPLSDLWELTFRGRESRPAWRQVVAAAPRPDGRFGATLTLDPEKRSLVLYGGETWSGYFFSDAWELSLPDLVWKRVTPAGLIPTARTAHSAVYCPDLHGILVFGGLVFAGSTLNPETNETWLLALKDPPVWTQLSPTTLEGPCAMQGHWAVWDGAGHRMLVSGGGSFLGSCQAGYAAVWSLSVPGLAWSRLDPSGSSPRAQPFAAAFFDPTSRSLYVHGGLGSIGNDASHSDAWRLTLDAQPAWTQIEPERATPQFRTTWQLPAVYDPRRDRILVDGGDRVWAYDVESAAWLPIVTSGDVPPLHWNNSAVLDTERNRLVIYGGMLPNNPPLDYRYPPFQEVWTLTLGDGPCWTRLPTSGPAPVTSGGAAVYDPVGDRLLVFAANSDVLRERGVWALALGETRAAEWRQIASSLDTVKVQAPGLPGAVVAYDSRRDRMVIFGGAYSFDTQIFPQNGCWSLALNGPPVWSALSPNQSEYDRDPALPMPRMHATAVYEEESDRLVVVGGHSSNFIYHIPDDAWALPIESGDWNQLRVETDPHPEWLNAAAVYDSRRDRTLVLQGDVVWGLQSGHERRKRLPLEDAVESQSTTLGPAVLELRSLYPNPFIRDLSVRFSLPDAAPASLELLDLAGRQVWSQDVGSLGGGAHVFRLRPERAAAPGLYLLRLTRGTASFTRKVVWLGQSQR